MPKIIDFFIEAFAYLIFYNIFHLFYTTGWKNFRKNFYFFPLLLPAPGIPLGFLEKIQPILSSRLVASLLSIHVEFYVEETPTTPSDNITKRQQHLATTKFWQSHYYLFHFITFSIENRIKINQFSGRTIRKAFLSLSRQRFKECRLNWTYHLRFFFQKVFTSDFLFFKFSY